MYRRDYKTTIRIAWALALLLSCVSGVQAQSLLTFHNFTGTEGAYPRAPLVQGTDGNLYGTTSGGRYDSGTVFKITLTGKLTTLHHFSSNARGYNPDGANPYAGLLQASDGNFYGTTYYGGAYNAGTIFRVSPSGAFTTLYTFSAIGSWPYSNADGAYPRGLIQAGDGNLYGTAVYGGANGAGTIFRISLSGAFACLYSFGSGTDGKTPYGGLVEGPFGLLYGTTDFGGNYDNGTVFSFNPNSYQETPIWQFSFREGAIPVASLTVDNAGNLYGTTEVGGKSGNGTIFRMRYDSIEQSWSLDVLHSFADIGDGRNPTAGLVLASDGYLYGTTLYGSPLNYGTLFKLASDGTLTTLHTFTGYNPGHPSKSDGAYPSDAPVQVSDGDIYGTTEQGGIHQFGTIYRFTYKPVVTGLAPASRSAGAPSFALTVKGVNFKSSSIVRWNGTNLPTVYGSSEKLTASVDASLVSSPGTCPITVLNPDGSLSHARNFVVYLTKIKLQSATLTRNPTTGDYTANISVQNTGYQTATNVLLKKATLSAATTSTSLPLSLGTIDVGASSTASLTFPASAGTSGTVVVMKVSGTFTGGTFSGSLKETLP